MSYASVAAANVPPHQPRPDPALLHTSPPTHPAVADDAAKLNVVAPDFKQHPRTFTSEARKVISNDNGSSFSPLTQEPERESENDCFDVWETTKHYLFQPGVAGGVIGISMHHVLHAGALS